MEDWAQKEKKAPFTEERLANLDLPTSPVGSAV
jgi:hypothetical protein